ncbi:MAG TPA: WD40 repeat domain-containing protein [Pirellulaceae bacterium]|nr:WD40 repeat domain-containing protein [Pirellulaceae bacterium]
MMRSWPPNELLCCFLWQAVAVLAAATEPEVPGLPPALVLDHGGLFRPQALGGRDLILLTLAFSPDGKTIASAGGGPGEKDAPAQGEVKLWEVATGRLLRTLTVENGIVFHAEYSPDGQCLATASGPGTSTRTTPGEIRLWSPATGRLAGKLTGHDRGAYVAAFSPDGRRLASGGIATIDASRPAAVRGGNATGDLKLWDLQTGRELWTGRGHSGAVAGLVFSPDGKTLASSGGLSDGNVKLWDAAAGTQRRTFPCEAEVVRPVAFGPKSDSLTILSFGLTGPQPPQPFTVQISRWNLIETQPLEAVSIRNGNAYRLALSHDGGLLACACHDGVKVYDVRRQVELCSIPSQLRTRPVSFSPDDSLLAAGCDDGTVKVWNVAGIRK